jgi:hypothetical protein
MIPEPQIEHQKYWQVNDGKLADDDPDVVARPLSKS